MSADYWVAVEAVGPLDGSNNLTVWNANITYNLGPMLRAAGFGDWDSWVDLTGQEAGPKLLGILTNLRNKPEYFREFNPSNGWGTYEDAVEFVRQMAVICMTFPSGRIHASL